jgi:hypothetical protein
MRRLARIAIAALVVGTAVSHLHAEEPETVVITLHAKPGAAAELEKVVARHWETARRLKLVRDEAGHLTMRGVEQGDQTFVMEVFTWRDAAIPDAAPKEIQAIWAEMNALVEKRGGRPGLTIDQVSIVAGGQAQR